MAYIVRMPKLGVEMQTGVVLEWTVGEGESVESGDVLAEIESEKTVAEVAAREDGVLRYVGLEAGAEVEPGAPMGIVAGPDEAVDELLAEFDGDGSVETDEASEPTETDRSAEPDAGERDEAASDTAAPPSGDGPSDGDVRATPKARVRADEGGVDLASVRGTGPKGSVTVDDVERAVAGGAPTDVGGTGSRSAATAGAGVVDEAAAGDAPATPRARKRAAELGVDLASVRGTGPHGSIREADVETADAEQTAVPSPRSGEPADTDASADGRTLREERPLTGMRSTIARRLSESWEAPHVTVDRRIDVEATLEAAERAGDAVSITDVLLRAVSETLAAHPEFNATLEDGVHRLYEEHNVGFAVDVEPGLITPVLKGVEHMSVVELAHERGALTERVRRQRHGSADLQGGTFTISNLGVLGIDSFTPIINPPQVAILGVNRIREDPRRTDRGIEFRRTIGFSLSFDHRAIDGADAARFLDTLAEHLERAEELVE